MYKEGKFYTVPWVSKAEWLDVRDKLTSSKVKDVIEAYETMAVWKARSDGLPAFVECTYGMLKVMVQDHMLKGAHCSEYDTRLSYSTEIIRFVNHIHNVTRMKGSSLYSSAKVNNIPDWLVTLRHEAAHGQTLPALETYHLAAKVCMKWLLKNYWFLKEKFTSKQEQPFKLYAGEFLVHNVNVRLFALYKKTIRLWETCCEISNDCLISDLPNEQLYYISNLVRLYKSHEYTSKNGEYCNVMLKRLNTYCVNSNEHRLKDFKRSVIELMKYITNHERPKNTFIYTLLQADFMFDFMHVEWREVIYFVQMVKCLDLFIKSLFDQVMEDNFVAVEVLEALAPAVKNLRRQWPRFKEKFKRKSMDKKDKLRMKKRYSRSYKGLKFPLKLQKPPLVTLDMLEELFKNPTRRTRGVISKFLPIVEPELTEEAITAINQLLDIYCDTDTTLEIADPFVNGADNKVYTMEDLKIQFCGEKEVEKEKPFSMFGNRTWNTSDLSPEIWSSAPLGLLPGQTTVDLTIPEEFQCQDFDPRGIQPMPPLTLSRQEVKDLLDFEGRC